MIIGSQIAAGRQRCSNDRKAEFTAFARPANRGSHRALSERECLYRPVPAQYPQNGLRTGTAVDLGRRRHEYRRDAGDPGDLGGTRTPSPCARQPPAHHCLCAQPRVAGVEVGRGRAPRCACRLSTPLYFPFGGVAPAARSGQRGGFASDRSGQHSLGKRLCLAGLGAFRQWRR